MASVWSGMTARRRSGSERPPSKDITVSPSSAVPGAGGFPRPSGDSQLLFPVGPQVILHVAQMEEERVLQPDPGEFPAHRQGLDVQPRKTEHVRHLGRGQKLRVAMFAFPVPLHVQTLAVSRELPGIW